MTALSRLPERAVLDGAMGTELIARGMKVGRDCPERWNVDRPQDVAEVHQRYLAAGVHAIQTNTFGGNRLRLMSFGRQTEVRQINMRGVALAREAVACSGRDALVVGSVGPTGAMPPPEGTADLIELEDVFAEQAMALAEGGVDVIHIETLFHPKEARAAIRGVREGAPGVPLVASVTCRRTPRGYMTPIGFPSDVLFNVLAEEAVDGWGANCTLPPATMLDLILAMRARTDAPIWARPTVVPPQEAPLLPEELATGALALFAGGATAVGGCCGAGPADIQALARAPASSEIASVSSTFRDPAK